MTGENNKVVITIDGKDYAEDQLTDTQKVIINHINDLERKIRSAQFNLDQMNVGKDAFIQMLKGSLEEEAAE